MRKDLTASALNFRKTLNSETDRGKALMAAAYLEEQIGILIQASLINDSKATEFINGALAPLGTFSAKIEFAFLIGLLDENTYKDLHTIRKIRNEFGHDPSPITFETDSIKDMCNNLIINIYNSPEYVDEKPKPGQLFTNTVMGIASVIHNSITKTSHAEKPKRVNFIVESKKDLENIFDELDEHFNGEEWEEVKREIAEKLFGSKINE